MFQRLALTALAVVAALLSGCVSAKHVFLPKDPTDPVHRDLRQFLNKHIIAVNEDGMAIDPYSYRYEGKSAGAGFFKSHWGGEVKLQVPVHGPDSIRALTSIGYTVDEAATLISALPSTAFVFKDVVVPGMLQEANKEGKRIVVYVHGGLNNLDDAIERAESILMNATNTPSNSPDRCYPIFVCWPSALGSSYAQHLLNVRSGVDIKQDKATWRRMTLPIYLLTDLATSAVRMPRVALDLGRTGFKPDLQYSYGDVQDGRARYYALRYAEFLLNRTAPTQPTFDEWTGSLQPHERKDFARLMKAVRAKGMNDETAWNLFVARFGAEWQQIHSGNATEKPVEVSMGAFDKNGPETFRRSILGLVTLPPKLALTGGLSAVGSESWTMMKRRVEAMYHHEKSFRPFYAATLQGKKEFLYEETNFDLRDKPSTGVGAMAVFLRALAEAQANGLRNPVELYGHSMGALVLNRGLQEFPTLKVDRVVYMAAACSIKDFLTSVVPYIQARSTNSPCEFYNLCLNPRAEERELVFGDVLPRGSLLVWIDDFLERPGSFEDRTLGQFENAMLASRTIPVTIQQHVHMTAMPAGRPFSDDECGQKGHGKLQTHAGFSAYRFWENGFVDAPGWNYEEREKIRMYKIEDGHLVFEKKDQTK